MKLYKFRGNDHGEILNRDLKSLCNNQYFAASISSLNDPCENMINQAILDSDLELLNDLFKIDAKQEYENIKTIVKTLIATSSKYGIYSLSVDNYCPLLWAHYASNHFGYCIEYSKDDLLRLNDYGRKEFDVIYEEKPPCPNISTLTENSDNSIKSEIAFLGTKSKSWKYEKEYRIIHPQYKLINYLDDAVTGIYFGIRMIDKEKELIMTELSGKGITFYDMYFEKNSYKLNSSVIKQDIITVSPNTQDKIEEDALQVTDKTVNESEYIKKVGYIVSQYKSCKSIFLVDKSVHGENERYCAEFEPNETNNPSGVYKIYFTPNEIESKYKMLCSK